MSAPTGIVFTASSSVERQVAVQCSAEFTMEHKIFVATDQKQIERCYPVLKQLRPHLNDADFGERVKRQQRQGYILVFLELERTVRAVAGYRLLENLSRGKFMYVDDLVTNEPDRSKGFGQELFDWLVDEAKRHQCAYLELDSGVQRFGAHRFYLQNRMDISSHHFSLRLA